MKIIGRRGDAILFDLVLPHGVDPYDLAAQQGYLVAHPLDAVAKDGEIIVSLAVQARTSRLPMNPPAHDFDPALALQPGVAPVRRQRVAAYALVRSTRGLLATEFSDRTAVSGQWGLPGGGIDEGEQPAAAVLREIAEETQQLVELGGLVAVQSAHWVGRAPTGLVEDFQAVRLIYTARCEQPAEPVVADLGGTTESARWVELDDWRGLNWTPGWQLILSEHLGPV